MKTIIETKVLDGNVYREGILAEIKSEINEYHNEYSKTPCIAFIGFEGVPLTKYNVPLHVNLAKHLGFEVLTDVNPEDISEADLFAQIDTYNSNSEVHALVVLQPIPPHLDPVRVMNRIDPEKEAEGFHPLNMMGTLMPSARENSVPMCLPTALAILFEEGNVQVDAEQEWVFVMDDYFYNNNFTSMVVKAAASRTVPKDCPMTIINSNSDKLEDFCKKADYLVLISRNPEFLSKSYLKPGVCIIDIYANLVKEIPSKKNPGSLVPIIRGGISAESAMGVASVIIPIPGGLMALVLALLFKNALKLFTNQERLVQANY